LKEIGHELGDDSLFLKSTTTEKPIFSSETTATPIITSTKSITTTTTLPITEPARIVQSDLVADANGGKDIYVYYPSNICILNGTQSRFLNSNNYIVKWVWTKSELSPAFGVTITLKKIHIFMKFIKKI
jgi:hypothetical protein